MPERLVCNACGAPLEVPESANFVTCNHCGSQLAIRRGESATFTEQLDRLTETTEELTDRLDELTQQNRLEVLDREWERERESLLIRDTNGRMQVPTTGAALTDGIVLTVIGSLWTIMAFGITSSEPSFGSGPAVVGVFPLFGVVFVIFGLISCFQGHQKATQYREAEQKFRARREQLQQDLLPD